MRVWPTQETAEPPWEGGIRERQCHTQDGRRLLKVDGRIAVALVNQGEATREVPWIVSVCPYCGAEIDSSARRCPRCNSGLPVNWSTGRTIVRHRTLLDRFRDSLRRP
jgi:zinc-ribbon domain